MAPIGPLPKDRHAPRPLVGGDAGVQESVRFARKFRRLWEGREEEPESAFVDGVERERHAAVWNSVLLRDRRGGRVQVAAEPAEEGDHALRGKRFQSAHGFCGVGLVVQDGDL